MKHTTTLLIGIAVAVVILIGLYLSAPTTPVQPPAVVPPVQHVANTTPQKTPSPFDLMSDDDLYHYALNQSLATGNVEDCEVIRNENDKGNCKDIVNQYRAMHDDSTAACERITFSGTREACLETVHTRIATSEGNLGECDKIERRDIRTGCYDNVYPVMARTNLDKSICSKISTEAGKASCIAVVEADVQISQHPDTIAPMPSDPNYVLEVPPLDLPSEYMNDS